MGGRETLATAERGSILGASWVDCSQPLPGASIPTLSEKFSDFNVAIDRFLLSRGWTDKICLERTQIQTYGRGTSVQLLSYLEEAMKREYMVWELACYPEAHANRRLAPIAV